MGYGASAKPGNELCDRQQGPMRPLSAFTQTCCSDSMGPDFVPVVPSSQRLSPSCTAMSEGHGRGGRPGAGELSPTWRDGRWTSTTGPRLGTYANTRAPTGTQGERSPTLATPPAAARTAVLTCEQHGASHTRYRIAGFLPITKASFGTVGSVWLSAMIAKVLSLSYIHTKDRQRRLCGAYGRQAGLRSV